MYSLNQTVPADIEKQLHMRVLERKANQIAEDYIRERGVPECVIGGKGTYQDLLSIRSFNELCQKEADKARETRQNVAGSSVENNSVWEEIPIEEESGMDGQHGEVAKMEAGWTTFGLYGHGEGAAQEHGHEHWTVISLDTSASGKRPQATFSDQHILGSIVDARNGGTGFDGPSAREGAWWAKHVGAEKREADENGYSQDTEAAWGFWGTVVRVVTGWF